MDCQLCARVSLVTEEQENIMQELKDSILAEFAKELEFGSTLTLEQKLEVMTDLANALYNRWG
jgi:hypothetical protein